MALVPNFTEDIAYISKLGDNPNTDNGFNSAQLKSEFDKAALAIQKFINTYIVATLNNEVNADAFLKLAGGAMKGNIAMGGNRVTDLGTPVEDTDAVSKAFLAGLVFSVSQGGTGGKTPEEARKNLGAAAETHTHTESDISERTSATLTAILSAGYMVLSNKQIVESIEAIPADAPEGAFFVIPIGEAE